MDSINESKGRDEETKAIMFNSDSIVDLIIDQITSLFAACSRGGIGDNTTVTRTRSKDVALICVSRPLDEKSELGGNPEDQARERERRCPWLDGE